MKLRELVHKAGGINSPVMEFEVDVSSAGKFVRINTIETDHQNRRIHIEIEAHDVRFLNKEIEERSNL